MNSGNMNMNSLGGTKVTNPHLLAVGWLLITFVSIWLSGICAGPYILIYCVEACIPALKVASDLLLRGVQLPNWCATNMMLVYRPQELPAQQLSPITTPVDNNTYA